MNVRPPELLCGDHLSSAGATHISRYDLRESRSGNEHVALVLILLLGAFLRVSGIWAPLPYYTSDEANFMWPAMSLAGSHFNPYAAGAWFGHPGHLLMYILSFSFGIFYAVGKLFGYFPNYDDFEAFFVNQPMSFYLIGRAESVIYAILTILITYLIAKRWFSGRVALLSALFLAVSPLHVERSQIVRTDILMTFLVALSFLFSTYVFERRGLKYYLLSGGCIGLGAATKYPAVAAVVPLMLAHLLAKDGGRSYIKKLFDRRLILGLSSIPLAFAAGAPFVILEIRRSIRSLGRATGLSGSVTGQPRLYSFDGTALQHYWGYVTSTMNQGHGVIVQVLFGLGILYLLVRLLYRDPERGKYMLLLSFPVFFILVIGLPSKGFSHWLLPVLPFTSIIAAVGLVKILELTKEKLPRLRLNAAMLLVAAASLVMPGYQIAEKNWLKLQKHPYAIANEWIEQNIPQGSIIAVEEYTPPVSTAKYNIMTAPEIGKLKQISPQHDSVTNLHGKTWRFHLANVQDFSVLNENRVEYVVISLTTYDLFKKHPDGYREELEFYDAVFREGELIYEIKPDKRQGGPVRIYKLTFSH